MSVVHMKEEVPFSQSQMFTLVDRIKEYSEFLPWCHESVEMSRTIDEVRARLHLSHGGFKKSFSTCNRLHKNKMIEIKLLDGPFHHLEGFWRFDELNTNRCRVSFDLEFEFASKLIGFAFGPVFNQIANTLLDAFVKRAHEVYGKKK